jgi:ribosomal protein L37AE/L43A
MSALSSLPTLGDLQRTPRATPKDQLPSRLDTKTAADTDDAKALEQWAKKVRHRDRERCRVCGVKTVRTLALDPKRGEAHHLRPRSCQVTRTDVRNGIWTCLSCHQKLTRHKLFPIGTGAMVFRVGRGITAKSYLDGTCDLKFKEKKPDG